MRIFIFLLAGLLFLAACESTESTAEYPPFDPNYGRFGKITGEDGLVIFGGDKKSGGGAGEWIGVNSYLWRAALDTTAFLPLLSADPFGGVIISDWYTAAETPDERIKMTVYILSRELRSDGVKVAVFRQVKKGTVWVDAKVADQTAKQVEDAILSKARNLRIADISTAK